MNAAGIPQSSANKYLGVLGDLKIIDREVPITEKTPAKSKRGYYRIVDEFFRFWFKFVFPYRADRIFPFSAVGRWWNKEGEIDVVALNPELR